MRYEDDRLAVQYQSDAELARTPGFGCGTLREVIALSPSRMG